ncbi:MAG: VanZ family protein [Methylomonas sp.]
MQSSANNIRIVVLLVLMILRWIALLFVESSGPPAEVMGKMPGLDKIAHIAAYGILGLMVCALSFRLKHQPKIALLSVPLLFVSLVGIAEEGFQHFVPGRTASLPDALADVCGAVFSILLANYLAQLSRNYEKLRS